jgi:hypothetical protein
MIMMTGMMEEKKKGKEQKKKSQKGDWKVPK